MFEPGHTVLLPLMGRVGKSTGTCIVAVLLHPPGQLAADTLTEAGTGLDAFQVTFIQLPVAVAGVPPMTVQLKGPVQPTAQNVAVSPGQNIFLQDTGKICTPVPLVTVIFTVSVLTHAQPPCVVSPFTVNTA